MTESRRAGGVRRGVLLASLLAVAGLSGACVPDVREPDVRLDGIRVGGLGLEGGVLNVRLRVVNPNGFGLEASSLQYRLELADSTGDAVRWVPLAEGNRRQEMRVGPRDSTVVEIPGRFEYRDLGTGVRSSRAARSAIASAARCGWRSR